MEYIRDMSLLLKQAEEDWPSVHQRLVRLRDLIFSKAVSDAGQEGVVINLTGEPGLLSQSSSHVSTFLNKLPTKQSSSSSSSSLVKSLQQENKLLARKNEGFAVPSQVNYVVKGGSLFSPGEAVKASYGVVSKYLSTGYLWDNVRVMGGAYGGFARFGEASGRFMFMSYRDPNLADTLRIYDAAAEALLKADVTEEDVLQAVIGSIGDLDSPLSPDQKGYVSMMQYISGTTGSNPLL